MYTRKYICPKKYDKIRGKLAGLYRILDLFIEKKMEPKKIAHEMEVSYHWVIRRLRMASGMGDAYYPINDVMKKREAAKNYSNYAPGILKNLKSRVCEYIPLRGSCVYFLCSGDKVVYVGQTNGLPLRIEQHIETKCFDRVFYLPVRKEDLNKIETEYIRSIKPIYNFQIGRTSSTVNPANNSPRI